MANRHSGLLFVILGFIWGSAFIGIEVGLEYFPPVLYAGLRYYIAGVAILVFAVLSTDYWWPRRRADWLGILITGVFVIAGTHAFVYLGQQYVSGAVAAVVISLSPVLTVVFASIILDNRLTMLGMVGLALGLLGVGLITKPDPANLLSANVVGVSLVFAAAVCFALGGVLSRPVRTEMPVQSLQAWSMLFGSVLLHVTSLLRGETFAAIQWTPTAAGTLLYLGIVPGAIAFLIYFELLDRLGPAEINLIGYLEPVSATVLSWLLLGELIDPLTALGFLSIFAGFTLIKRHSLRRLADRYELLE